MLKTCSPFGRVNMIWVTLISIQYISTRIFTWTNERDVSYVMAMVTKWNPILFYTNRDVPRSGCLFLKSSFNTRLPLLLLLLSWSSTMGPPAKARLSSPTYTLQSNQQVQKTGPKDHDISYLLTRRRSSNNSSLPQQHGHRVPAMEMYRAL